MFFDLLLVQFRYLSQINQESYIFPITLPFYSSLICFVILRPKIILLEFLSLMGLG